MAAADDLATANAFLETYIDALDKNRSIMGAMFASDALLKWNGENFNGQEAIQAKLNQLPESEHWINILDLQAVEETTLYLVTISGYVQFEGSVPKQFWSSVTVSYNNNVWCILMNVYTVGEL